MENPDAILSELSKIPCGNLAAIARRVLAGERRIRVPGFRKPLRFRIHKGKNSEVSGLFVWPHPIPIWAGNKGSPAMTIIHEIRHAQQREALGARRFGNACGSPDRFLDPLEIDADAAEIACGSKRPRPRIPKGTDPGIAKIQRMIECLRTKQARAIGGRR